VTTPLDEIPLVDHHAHAVLRSVPTLDEFRGLFSESPHPAQWPHVATSLTYRRALAEVASLLDVEPHEQAVYEARAALAPAAYARLLMGPTNTAWLLLDDGFPAADEGFSLDEMAGFAGAAGAPVMRLERVAEEALDGTLEVLREHVRDAVAAAAAGGAVGLKTIAAYRTGLAVGSPDPAAAAHALRTVRGRLAAKPLLDLLLWDALEANEQAAEPLPLQVHAGFGDSDLRLPLADPTYLAPLIGASHARRSCSCTATRSSARPAGSPTSTRTCTSTCP
jgi:hypothetical protein